VGLKMASTPISTIRYAATPSDLAIIRTLFTAYASSLGVDLSFQNFNSELSSLPGLYAPPTGALLLAVTSTDEAVGCVGLRPLSSCTPTKICEMKRLYCTPSSRGVGIGRALVERVIKEAEDMGYEEMRLDTLAHMDEARKLYASLGFEEMNAYYETPLEEETKFLRKKLGGGKKETLSLG
jgi:ribosomal protein S18 acetylase RimI-like enzyme